MLVIVIIGTVNILKSSVITRNQSSLFSPKNLATKNKNKKSIMHLRTNGIIKNSSKFIFTIHKSRRTSSDELERKIIMPRICENVF